MPFALCDKKDSSSDSANRKEETFLLFRLWGIEITAVDTIFHIFSTKLDATGNNLFFRPQEVTNACNLIICETYLE